MREVLQRVKTSQHSIGEGSDFGPSASSSGLVSMLHALRSYAWAIIPITILGIAAGFLVSKILPAEYRATTSLHLSDPRAPGLFTPGDTRADVGSRAAAEAEAITSEPVLSRARVLLDNEVTIEGLRSRVNGIADPELNIVRVQADANRPGRAAEIANAVGHAYEEIGREQRHEQTKKALEQLANYEGSLQSSIKDLDSKLNGLQATAQTEAAKIPLVSGSLDPVRRVEVIQELLDSNPQYESLRAQRTAAYTQLGAVQTASRQLAIESELAGAGIVRFEQAEVPKTPIRPRTNLNMLIGGLLALLVSSALAWAKMERIRPVWDRLEPAGVLGAPLLAELPPITKRGKGALWPVLTARFSRPAEAFRFAASAIQSSLKTTGESPSTSLMVAGISRGDGASVCALNLALAASMQGQSAVVMDGDLRTRGLSLLARLSTRKGIADWKPDDPKASPETFHTLRETPNFFVMPAGTDVTDPVEFLSSPSFAGVMRAAERQGNFVLVDSPPVLGAADCLQIVTQVKGVILVVRRGVPSQELEEAARWISLAHVPLIGYVFNLGSRETSAMYSLGSTVVGSRILEWANGLRHRRDKELGNLEPSAGKPSG